MPTSPAAIGVQQSIAEGPEVSPWVLFGALVIWVHTVQPLLGHAQMSAWEQHLLSILTDPGAGQYLSTEHTGAGFIGPILWVVNIFLPLCW